MKFQTLQENLRKALLARIDDGALTGLELAHKTGFQQAHISNFLNRKRGLSLEGMDKVLASQKISVLDLLDPAEINKRASIPPPAEEGFENVLLADAALVAREALITREKVRDILKFKKAFLRKLKADMVTPRQAWQRFVLIRVGPEAMSMFPRLLPGAVVLIDRHYNSLKPYRRTDQNMYAVRKDDGCIVRYVELSGANLVLRPHNQAHPVDVIPVEHGNSYGEYIVGRVCYVGIET